MHKIESPPEHLAQGTYEGVRTERHKGLLPVATAVVVTTAAFAKLFLPFYLIGSTAIFAIFSAIAAVLIALSWRPLLRMAHNIADALALFGALYGWVIANFLIYSHPLVPITHLLGILIFHSLYVVFGFAAARSSRTVLMMMLAAAAVYALIFIRYTVQFGDPAASGYLRDILGVGNPIIYGTFHQQIGIAIGLAALAAIGLATNRIKLTVAIGALPFVMYVLLHISARGALVALVFSLTFLTVAGLWIRSRKLALLSVLFAVVLATLTSGLLYYRAVQDENVNRISRDAITRTIREIRDSPPGLRWQIWSDTWTRILAEPDRLLLGRGVGIYPVHEGVGPPDWHFRPTKASQVHPHNVLLEMLYETGIVGLLLFTVAILFPLAVSLKYWRLLSPVQRAVSSMYVFHLVNSEISGSFGFGYLDLFFFAMTAGIIALIRNNSGMIGDEPTHMNKAT